MKGASLVELLLATALGLLVVAMAASPFAAVRSLSEVEQALRATSHDAVAVDRIVRRVVRSAGFAPLGAPGCAVVDASPSRIVVARDAFDVDGSVDDRSREQWGLRRTSRGDVAVTIGRRVTALTESLDIDRDGFDVRFEDADGSPVLPEPNGRFAAGDCERIRLVEIRLRGRDSRSEPFSLVTRTALRNPGGLPS